MVDSIGTLSTAASQSASSATSQALMPGSYQVDFLKLMVAQLQNQDPMNVQDQKDFLGQLAQFESVSQMVKLNQNVQSLALAQGLAQSSSLIGKWAEIGTDSSGKSLDGIIKAVRLSGDKSVLVINGQEIDLAQLKGVTTQDDSSGAATDTTSGTQAGGA